MKSIGSNIKKIRELKNFTQAHVAKKLGMSQSNYARIENGRVKFDADKLRQIAVVLETTVKTIEFFDEKLHQGLTNDQTFNPDPKDIIRFFSELKKLYAEEIVLLQKKIKLLEILSS
jgi:transcriptional regulator with XRE-family HTH domain